MYTIEETNYGYRMIFEGFLRRDDVDRWVQDIRKQMGSRSEGFGVLVDLRAASAFPADAQDKLFEGIELSREKGMERTSVVVANPISKIQAVRVCKETGIYDTVKFIDASSDPDWESSALDWIQKAVVPAEA